MTTIELIADNDILEVLIPGEAGPPGDGLPAGGSTGQKLVKLSGADRDTGWTDDFAPASQAEVEAGTENTKFTTSLRVAQAISSRIDNTLSSASTTLALSAAQGKVLQDSKAPLASPAFSGTPTAPTAAAGNATTQIATTQFVTSAVAAAVAGQSPRAAVRVVATSNVTLSGTQTIDGVSLSAGDHVLVAGNTAGAENGPYVVAAGAWSRRTDFDSSGEAVTGASFFVTEGTARGGTTWTLTTTGAITLGTTPLVFSQTGASGGNAGNGLVKNGSTLSLAPLAPGQVFLGNGSSVATAATLSGALSVDGAGVVSLTAGGITNSHINAAAAIADTKLATISTAGKVANSATTAASANTPGAIVARDGSGNFSAGVITANLTGTASLATAGTTQAVSDASTNLATTLYVKRLFGAAAPGGVADWNNVANTRAGCGPNLLSGNASNGPAGSPGLFHPLNLESGSAKDGSGDLAQLAIGQGLVDVYMRIRNGGAWSGWQRLLHDGNIGSYAAILTAANTFINPGGQTARASTGQDGVTIKGRGGGTSGFAVELVPAALSGTRTLTLPDVNGTVITTGDSGTVSNAMLATISAAGKVANSATTATAAATPNAIVARDGSGNFSANAITLTSGLTTASLNGGPLAGMRNRLINGAMAVDQRNTGASQTFTAGPVITYAVDRWYATCSGANVVGQQVAGASAGQFRYRFTGVVGTTGITFGQRIEQLNSADLAGQTVTLGVDLANSLLNTVTWALYYANAADNFATRTLINTGTFTVNSTVSRYSVQVALPAAATTGLELVFSVGAQTSGTWTIGDVQLEAGSVATPLERRLYGQELALCQRYHLVGTIYGWGWAGAGGPYRVGNASYAQMRATPSIGFLSAVGDNASYQYPEVVTSVGFGIYTIVGTGGPYAIYVIYAAYCEL